VGVAKGQSQIQSQTPVPSAPTRCSSPITEYPPGQWINAGLMSFLRYCAQKYDDEDYLEYFVLLKRERLGIDVYKVAIVDIKKREKLEDILVDNIHIPSGTIERWLKDFDDWYVSIKGTVFMDRENVGAENVGV
jgi:hypothetical protein